MPWWAGEGAPGFSTAQALPKSTKKYSKVPEYLHTQRVQDTSFVCVVSSSCQRLFCSHTRHINRWKQYCRWDTLVCRWGFSIALAIPKANPIFQKPDLSPEFHDSEQEFEAKIPWCRGRTPQAWAQHMLSQNNPRPYPLTNQQPPNLAPKFPHMLIQAEAGCSFRRGSVFL